MAFGRVRERDDGQGQSLCRKADSESNVTQGTRARMESESEPQVLLVTTGLNIHTQLDTLTCGGHIRGKT